MKRSDRNSRREFTRDFPAGDNGWGTRVVARDGEVEVFTTGPYTGRYPHKPMSLDQSEALAIGILEANRTARQQRRPVTLAALRERMQERGALEDVA